MIGLVLTALLFPDVQADELVLPTVERGPIKATLAIRVAEQTSVPGLARVRLRLTVEGPPDLRIELLPLEDALSAWRVPVRSSSMGVDERTHWECTFDLVQTKPGVVPLPGVSLRLRSGGSVEKISWPDPLHEAADVAPPIAVPPLPPSPWPARLHGLGLALLGAILVLLLGVGVRRRLRRPEIPQPAALARAEIDRLGLAATPADLDRIVRAYLGSLGVPATRATRSELVSAIRLVPWISEPTRSRLESLLSQGEELQFAGIKVEAQTIDDLARLAREIIALLEQEDRSRERQGRTGEVG